MEILKNSVKAAIQKPTRVEIKRKHVKGVTKGEWKGYIDGKCVVEVNTIELKWDDNKPRVSCIPEGVYPLRPAIWQKHKKKVLQICNVPNRSHILVHPANFASGKNIQLLGCIAPVTGYADLDNDGIIDGTASRKAFDKIMEHFGNIECNIIIYS